ncbi:reverse transcriptase domain-containing protein [Tanacetum coccineum]
MKPHDLDYLTNESMDKAFGAIVKTCVSLRHMCQRTNDLGQYESVRSLWMSACNLTMNGCKKLAEEKAMLNVEVIKDEDDDDSLANKLDMITPMCCQLTYEGLLDEPWRMMCTSHASTDVILPRGQRGGKPALGWRTFLGIEAGYYPAGNSKLLHTSSPDDDKRGFGINTKPFGISREEGVLWDLLTSSVMPSAMRDFYEKHYTQILPFMAEKAHNKKLKDVRSRLTYREDTEQETESASHHRKRKRRVNANGKMNVNTKGVIGKTQGTSSWKAETTLGEGTGRDNLKNPRNMKAMTCPSLMMRNPPTLLLEESTNLCSPKESRCLPLKYQQLQGSKEEILSPLPSAEKIYQGSSRVASCEAKKKGSQRKPLWNVSQEDFRRCPRERRGDRFMPLTKTPKEILAMEARKGTFTTPPPMSGAPESRNKNKYCDFHGDKGHNTDDCLHLKRQIKEAVRSGQLAHLVKEIKQGGNKASTNKTVKKAETA